MMQGGIFTLAGACPGGKRLTMNIGHRKEYGNLTLAGVRTKVHARPDTFGRLSCFSGGVP